jgi:hypothetical protein
MGFQAIVHGKPLVTLGFELNLLKPQRFTGGGNDFKR